MRRALALALLVGAAAAVPTACGDEPGYFSPSQVASGLAYQRPTDEEVAEGAGIVRRVGAELYAPLADEAGDGNLTYSPVSIATVLGMVRAGAEGDSAAQLDALLGAEAPHRALGASDQLLASLDAPVELADGSIEELELTTANAVWGQSGVTWKEPFLDLLRAGYDAPMWMADFTGDPDAARADINDWVASRTGERITELLPPGSLTTDTRMVLTNALYLEAPWPAPLDELSEWTFTTASGEERDVPMLGATGTFATASGDGWQAVTMPYAGGDLAMTFVLPDDLDTFEANLDADLLDEVTAGGEDQQVLLRLPAFTVDTDARLRTVLEGLGVTAPFEPSEDFLPMTDDEATQPLWVDDVHHQALVEVDRFGTVAAAATGAVMTIVSEPVTDVEINLTRPFLFVIHDVEQGTPAFIGRIGDPTDPAEG